MSSFSTISVIGLGYVGLPLAALLVTRGVTVIGVDVDEGVVRRINEGRAHFSEPDLDLLLRAAVGTGRLRAVRAAEPADAFIVAVPTPVRRDRSADLSHIESAARSIAGVLKKGDLIVLESTSPVGTTQALCDLIAAERPDLRLPTEGEPGDVHVACCPERILPGRVVFELVENDRIIGGINRESSERAAALYRLFVRGDLLFSTAPAAELAKLAENAYRDVNIAFANELSLICDSLGVNAWETIRLANRHPRVNILKPGPGVGGHCIAVDPWFLISAAPRDARLMRAARDVNDSRPAAVVDVVRGHLSRFKRPVVACLGLAYKPDVDDLRESPALKITQSLAEEDADILIVEPHIEALPASLAERSNVARRDVDEAIDEADVIVVLVAHSAFRDVSREGLMRAVVVDTVGIWTGSGT